MEQEQFQQPRGLDRIELCELAPWFLYFIHQY